MYIFIQTAEINIIINKKRKWLGTLQMSRRTTWNQRF